MEELIAQTTDFTILVKLTQRKIYIYMYMLYSNEKLENYRNNKK